MAFMDDLQNLTTQFTDVTSLPNGPGVVDIQRDYHFNALFSYPTMGAVQQEIDFALRGSRPFLEQDPNSAFGLVNPEITAFNEASAAFAAAQAESFEMLTFTALMAYISTLVKKVTPPQQTIETTEFKMGPLAIQMPSKVTMENFEVTFVHDVTGAVELFYRYMFLAATRAPTARSKGNGSMIFQELSKLAVSFTFTRTMARPTGFPTGIVGSAIDLGLEAAQAISGIPLGIPGSAHHFPKVFPISMEFTEFDKSAEGLADIKMTFIRLPTFKNMALFDLQGQTVS